MSLPSFDKISFSWNTRIGAKIYIRFKCLSTDFSRIKGVKGIPLRAQMENRWGTESESCYCKIKLFRDKGAERKNKDDAKQILKQLEKVYGKFFFFKREGGVLISLQVNQIVNHCLCYIKNHHLSPYSLKYLLNLNITHVS